MLPLIDRLSITVCKEVLVFASHFAFPLSDFVLTGMCWECVGASCQDICQTATEIHLHFEIKHSPAMQQNDADSAVKSMHHRQQEET